MWLFKHKFHADETLCRYKARLVSNGSSQQLGVDFDETFSLIVKSATVHTILSLFVSRKWPIHQFDVKNAFLNGDLSEFVYMHQPPGFVDNRQGSQVAYLLIYVDDIILTASCPALLQQIIGTMVFGLHLYVSATTSLVGYTYADWAGCPSTRSAEAEYWDVANVVTEIVWVRNLFRELHYPLVTATLVYCDNVSTVYMSINPVQHQRMKHIEIDIHFVCDMVTAGHVRVLHVPSRFQFANIFTKGLPSALFEDFRSSLSVRPPLALTAGAY
uniref:NBS-containing resistance-like protein n=1 Tax=Tanacetum cinerariifolium TaxID=118510 RepID=A0A699JZR6_TANCI|nr:NBS-containing resistance-like protein [Tanacetum cinerariifolium]